MTSGKSNLVTWYATLRLCIKTFPPIHDFNKAWNMLITHRMIFNTSNQRNPRSRPPKIPLRHTKDVSDVWHVYPQAVSMWDQYVPSFVYKILRALQQNLIKWKYDDIMRMVLYAIFILIANLHSHFFGVYVKMYNTSNTKLAR